MKPNSILYRRLMLLMNVITAFTLPLYAAEVNVGAFTELQTAINNFNDRAVENTTIVIGASFDITATLAITNASYTLTIRGDIPSRTLMRNDNFMGTLFTVGNDAKFVLENIIIDGNGSIIGNSGVLIRVNGGALVINEGATVQNNSNDNNYGSGVYVANNGKFTMNGGTISGNSSLYNRGGGVYVANNGTFTMNGGAICYNSAGTGGGIFFDGANSVFTMNGGTISDNNAQTGGGIFANGGTLSLGGTAIIKDNTKGIGAGVPLNNIYLADEKYLTLGTGVDGIALPATGMEIWVQSITVDSVIVRYGATEACAKWFHSDSSDKTIVHNDGQLIIK